MTLEAPQVTRRGDQPVPEIRVTLEELMAAHGWLGTTVRNGWGSASPPSPPIPTRGVGFHPAPDTLGGEGGGGGAAYPRNGPISWGKRLRARVRGPLACARFRPPR